MPSSEPPSVDKGSAGVLIRRLLPAAILVPPVLGGLQLAGERAGLYGFEFGLALFAMSTVVVFVMLVWRVAGSVRRTEIERQKVELALRESEQRFRMLTDTAPMLVWMSGTDKLCHYFNLQWLQFTGRTLEQESGEGWAQGVHPDDLDKCLEVYTSSFEKRSSFEMDYRLRRHDGEYRWILDRGVPHHNPGGEFLGYIGSCVDITDRKLAEAAERNLARAARLTALGELTAIIAHEVNQPLGAILINAETAEQLLNSPTPPLAEIRDILADIRKGDLRASEVIQRIRALVRDRELNLQTLNLNDVVRDVVRLVTGDARRRKVRIHEQLDSQLPLIQGDEVHLQQVLLNLLLNGMDAMAQTPEAARQLTLKTSSKGDASIQISVFDQGHGIREDVRPHIFQSFTTTKKEGTGLGLSIARSIIEAHGGRICGENNPQGGAVFRIELPTLYSLAGPPA